MLCFVYVLNFLDRQLLSILAKPIQDELRRHRRAARADQRALFRAVLLPARDPGRLARGPDQPGTRAVVRVRAVERGDGRLRIGVQLSAARRRRAWRSASARRAACRRPTRSSPTTFRRARAARRSGSSISGPPIGQALGVAFGASIAAAYSWRSAFVVARRRRHRRRADRVGCSSASRCAAGSMRADPRHAASAAPRQGRLLGDAARCSSRIRCCCACRSPCGATQFVTYAVLNFTTLFLMREKGMTLNEVAIYYALLIGIAISAGMYVSGRLIDRFAPRSKTRLCLSAGGRAGARDPVLRRLRLGADLAARAGCSSRCRRSSTTSISRPRSRSCRRRCSRIERVLAGALLLLVMNLIGLGLGPDLPRRRQRLCSRASHPDHSLQLAFYTLDAVLRPGRAVSCRWRAH